ncbi:MAG: hypothetical protein WAK31_22490 [Chthoniobacterales bacterium]
MFNKLLTLTMAIALTVGAKAQYSQYGAIENFYEANPDLPNASQYAGRLVNPNYLLIDWNRRSDMDSRMTASGFSRLGISSWEDHDVYGGGVPQRELAVAYARAIGADIIIYSTTTKEANPTYPTFEHWVGFYAKQGSDVRRTAPIDAGDPTWNDLSNAESHLQAAWDRLPAWKKNQLRAPERRWIVDKDAAPPARKLQMINERTAWLLQQG